MPQFIYIIRLNPTYMDLKNWTDETNATFGEHWNYLVGMHEKEKITLVGRTNLAASEPENRGFCIFEAESIEEATSIMQNDPCVAKGIMTGQVYPFNLSLFKGKPAPTH